MLTIIEGVLMRAEGKRIKPLATLNERIARMEASQPEMFTLVLWRILREFIRELYRRSDFDGPAPTGLNRHWILHGRDVTGWGQADSLRLFQAADTVSSLAD